MKTIRTFIAISLPENILGFLGEVQRDLKKSGLKFRWAPLKNIHLTLKFIGDLPVDQLESVKTVMSDTLSGYKSFQLNAGGLGVFPGLRRPRVIWAGMEGEVDRLHQLQKNLDQSLAAIGISAEKRLSKDT